MLRFKLQVLALVVFTITGIALPHCSAASTRKLAPNYRHWIEQEVPYIISSDEKKEFLSLESDEQRDSFISAFWRVRNPDPNSDSNSYKEEHYRRLAYANEHFGTARFENGWRTEMGRIYITLGAPKQRAAYHEQANLRPIEIWFYESQTPALPPYFYILFFKHSAAEDWSVYSPRMDGPTSLVTTGRGTNDNQSALSLIRKSVGDEAAKTTCTLIPGERADFDNFSPSMESDVLLSTISGLPDNPLTRSAIQANRLREHVTTSILTGDRDMTIGSVVYRDEEGRETLSYLLSSPRADSAIIGSRPDGTFYYDLALRTTVLTTDGKPVYEQEDQLTGKLTAAQAEVARKKIFAAEARIPLAPGIYTLVATLTNNINHVAARQHASVTVPGIQSNRIGISSLLQYAYPAAVPDPTNKLPFTASKVRFTPRAAQVAHVRAGEKLPLAFQLWLDPKQGSAPEKVHLRYVFGAVKASVESPTVESEDVDADNRDKAGNLVSGHTVDTSSFPPGTYRLVITATREGLQQPAYAAMTVHVEHADDFVDRWTAYGAPDPEGVAADDLKRGISAEAQGLDDIARGFYARSLTENSKDTRSLDRLAAVLDRRQQSEELANLSLEPVMKQSAVAEGTLLLISNALTKLGKQKEVVRMLDEQIKFQSPSVPLYQALASACEATGDTARARDLRTIIARLKQ